MAFNYLVGIDGKHEKLEKQMRSSQTSDAPRAIHRRSNSPVVGAARGAEKSPGEKGGGNAPVPLRAPEGAAGRAIRARGSR